MEIIIPKYFMKNTDYNQIPSLFGDLGCLYIYHHEIIVKTPHLVVISYFHNTFWNYLINRAVNDS